MGKLSRDLLIATLAFALCSCGSVSTTKPLFHEEELTASDEAIIYIYRMPNIVGGAGKFNVRLDDKKVGLLTQGAYFVLRVAPGEHVITVGDYNPIRMGDVTAVPVGSVDKERGKFRAEPKGVYYFRSDGPAVRFVSKDEAMQELPRMRYDIGL